MFDVFLAPFSELSDDAAHVKPEEPPASLPVASLPVASVMTSRGRRRRDRTQFSLTDLARLESCFVVDKYPDITTRERLAKELCMNEDRIQVR